MPDLANLDQALRDIWEKQFGNAEGLEAMVKALYEARYRGNGNWEGLKKKRDASVRIAGWSPMAREVLREMQPLILEAMRRAYRLAKAESRLFQQQAALRVLQNNLNFPHSIVKQDDDK